MPVELREVKDRRDLIKFVRFPFFLYKNNEFWVPPLIGSELNMLRSDRNPAFDHCETRYVLAYNNGKIVGRIGGIINHEYIRLWNRKEARFCWFDFVDDPEVSGALLQDIEHWALLKGLEGITGPMGFTTFEKQGILLEGFDETPTVSSAYNYEYYAKHLECLGYAKSHDYLEFAMRPPETVPERSRNIADTVTRRYNLRALHAKSRKELISYAMQALEVINAAYQPIVGFVPLTCRQVRYILKKYLSVINPAFTTIVIDENDRVVGFQIAMPSLSRAFQKAKGRLFPFGFFHIAKAIYKPALIDMLLVGVIPEYQNKGVNALFMTEIIRTCAKRKIRFAESNGLLEDNQKILQYLSHFEARQHKKRRLYFKDLV